MQNCTFREMTVAGASFTHANLSGAELYKVRFTACDFGGANFTRAYEELVEWEGCSFAGAKLRDSNVHGGSIEALMAGALRPLLVRVAAELKETKHHLTAAVNVAARSDDAPTALEDLLRSLPPGDREVIEAMIERVGTI
jgi:uncharacterized protein YjbI with pentapeptide repeats